MPPTSTGVGGAVLFEPPPELDVGETAVPVVLEPPTPPTPPTPGPAALDAVLAVTAEAADDWLASCEVKDAGIVVAEADGTEFVLSGLRVEVAKPLRLEAAAAMEDIDAWDAVDCAKKAAMADDCELRLPGLEDIAALEGVEVVAIEFVNTCPMYINTQSNLPGMVELFPVRLRVLDVIEGLGVGEGLELDEK